MEAVPWWECATQADLGGEEVTSPPLLSSCPPPTLKSGSTTRISWILPAVRLTTSSFLLVVETEVNNPEEHWISKTFKCIIHVSVEDDASLWRQILYIPLGMIPPVKIHSAKLAYNKYQILLHSETVSFLFTGLLCNLKIRCNHCLHLSQLREWNISIIVLERLRHREFLNR